MCGVSGIYKARIPQRRHRLPREDPRRHVRHARFKLFLWQPERHADILATILARMSDVGVMECELNGDRPDRERLQHVARCVVAAQKMLLYYKLIMSSIM